MVDIKGLAADQGPVLERIRRLSQEVWEYPISGADIGAWLENFDGAQSAPEIEQANALHLLSEFNHFGLREIREMLRATYRDLYRYPMVQRLRDHHGGTFDGELIDRLFKQERTHTRFLGMGNPSESGAHLLYYFRQVNKLPKDLFIHQHEILDRPVGHGQAQIAIDGLRRLVFIDDVLGSGSQATEYSEMLLEAVREAAVRSGVTLDISYYTLFAKEEGLSVARALEFNEVRSVHELLPSAEAFSETSRAYVGQQTVHVSREAGLALAEFYGRRISSGSPLGWDDGELLLGLHHNVPDNTLPIFWAEDGQEIWNPLFLRYDKVY